MGASHGDGAFSVLDIQHPDLRNFRGVTKNGQNFMTASLATQKPQYYQWKNQVKQFQQNHSNNECILLPLKHSYDEGGVCSTTGELTIEYESYPKLLSAQIRDRMRSKKKFTEAQLWYLLYIIASAREALVSEGYQIGDLQPRNIFLNAKQQIKVATKLSWPAQVSAYRKAVLEQGFGYLAPEDMVRLKLGAMDNKQNNQSQIFSIGLTMLSASILQPMKDIYLVKQNSIDEDLFNTRLSHFQQDKAYSDIFRATVTNMLDFQPGQRMNQQELQEFMFKHKDNLEAQKPLMFDNVGRKLQQSINVIVKKTNGGTSDATSRYSAVSSLQAISKQNTIRQHDSPDNALEEFQLKKMRQSEPSQNVIGYQLKNQGQNVQSPRGNRNQPFSPPNEGQVNDQRHVPPQVSPAKPEIVTPRWNTPTKPASQMSGSNLPNFHQQFPQLSPSGSGAYINQGPPISGSTFNYQNSPLYQPVQHGRPVGPTLPNGYQPVHSGRPVSSTYVSNAGGVQGGLSGSSTPTQQGSGVHGRQTAISTYIQNGNTLQGMPPASPTYVQNSNGVDSRQSATINQRHVPGNVTPPQPITPLYAQPQSHKQVSLADGPELNQRYKQFERPVTFGPPQAANKWTHENKITQVRESSIQEGAKSIDLMIETKKNDHVNDHVEMSQVKRKSKVSNVVAQNDERINEQIKRDPPKVVDSRVQEDASDAWVQIEAAKIPEEGKQQTASQKLQDLVRDAEKQIEAAKQFEQKPAEKVNKVVQEVKKETQTIKKDNQVKQNKALPQNKMAHSVKVWGVQKGKLQIQAVNEGKKEASSYTQGVKQIKVAPRGSITVKTSKQEQTISLESGKPTIQKSQKTKEPTAQQVLKQSAEKVKEAVSPLVEEAPAPIVEQAPVQKADESKQNPQRQIPQDNYILIEEASRATGHQSSLVQNDDNKLFLYTSKTTQGTFDQCWQQILKALVVPQDYSSLVKADKVHPLENSYGQFLKVGPAAMKVNLNKEQGKVWLQNLPSSRCQGDFLIGAIKDAKMRHYIWINSSLRYKQKHFPTKQVIEEALSVMKKNINSLH